MKDKLKSVKKIIVHIFKFILGVIIKLLNIMFGPLIRKLHKNKKFRKIFIISIIGVTIISLVTYFTYNYLTNRSTIGYDKISTLIKEEDDVIIYYFNSSSNKNKNIKNYLDELGIRYYQYNDKYVDKEEYSKFLKLIGIDKKLFGCPSIIYIKNGKMYANLINIDSKDVVKTFVNDYDLYTVK